MDTNIERKHSYSVLCSLSTVSLYLMMWFGMLKGQMTLPLTC